MSKRKDIDLIKDIKESIERILNYTANIEYSTFKQDYKTQDAVIRNIEVIGEAVKSLSDNIKEENPHVQWRNMANTRNKLIHDYFGINIDIIWDIVKNDMPKIENEIKEILEGF